MPIADVIKRINCLGPDSILTIGVCNNVHSVESYLKSDTITKCPVCAYQIKRIAFYGNFQKSNQSQKAKWLRLWLRHCLSKETDYIFQVLKEVKDENGEVVARVDRESDVEAIASKYLEKDAPLAKHIGSTEGVKFYKKTIADWFLRRYNGTMARKILKPFSCWDKLKLFYPRMLVAIIIGLLALMTGQEGWNFPHKLFPDTWGLLSLFSVVSLSISLFAVTVLYLTYECYNAIADKKEALKRALRVGLKGYLISLSISLAICIVVGRISVDRNVVASYYSLFGGDLTLRSMLPVLKNAFFFASAALFIGIFIQVFWEKETITEPL